MEAAILAWLHDVAIRAFGLSLFVMLAINGVFAVIVLVTKDREIGLTIAVIIGRSEFIARRSELSGGEALLRTV